VASGLCTKGSSSRLTETVIDEVDCGSVRTGAKTFGARGLKIGRIVAANKNYGERPGD
jgi:hypothetical protein